MRGSARRDAPGASRRGAPIGTLGASRIVTVDTRAGVYLPTERAEIEWLVGSADRWRRPGAEASVRQRRIGGAPAVETRLAVAGGDIVHQVYATAGRIPVAIIDVRNDSAEAVAFAMVVRGEPGRAVRELSGADGIVLLDGNPILSATRRAQHAATANDAAHLVEVVMANGTAAGSDFVCRERRREVAAALVWAIPHRTSLRAAIPLVATSPGELAGVDLAGAPDAAAAVRGWDQLLERGMRFEHDDTALAEIVDAARGALLLLAGADRPRPGSDEAVACEDWGFDEEALAVWAHLGGRHRRAAARRDPSAHAGAWVRLRSHVQQAASGPSAQPARLLRALHEVLLRETDAGVELLGGFPAEWLGQNLAVHDAPSRRGPVSFAVRWHGPRPALLWSAPAGVTLRAPRLDPAWEATGGDGEVLLDAPRGELLALGVAAPSSDVSGGDEAAQEPNPPEAGSFT